MVVHEIRGDAIQVVAPMIGALEDRACPQETVLRLLQEIVGEPIVSRHPREIDPDRTCGLFVEQAERILGHLERSLGVIEGPGAFHICQRNASQFAHVCCSTFGRLTSPMRAEMT